MKLNEHSDLSIETYLQNIDQQCDPHEIRYRELVYAIGEGRESLTSEKEFLVLATGRTIDTFHADVATYQRRLEASNQIKEASSLTAEIEQAGRDHEKAAKELAAFEEEFERFRAEQRAEIESLRTRIGELNSQKIRNEQSANEVLLSTWDFALEQSISHGQRMQQLREELTTVNNEVNRHLNDIEQNRSHFMLNNPGATYEAAAERHPNKTPEHFTTRRMSIDRQIRQIEQFAVGHKAAKLDPRRMRWAVK